jgi:hypothetical protein
VVTTAQPGKSSRAVSSEPRVSVSLVSSSSSRLPPGLRQRQVEAVTLSAGEQPSGILLVDSLGSERGEVGA